jgi:hypothetical protein
LPGPASERVFRRQYGAHRAFPSALARNYQVWFGKVTHGSDYSVEQRRPSPHLLRLGLAVELDENPVRALNQDCGTVAFLLLASRTVQGLQKRP